MSDPAREAADSIILLLESARSTSGKSIGWRLSVGKDSVLIFQDQEAMPGIRIGREFVAEIGESVEYSLGINMEHDRDIAALAAQLAAKERELRDERYYCNAIVNGLKWMGDGYSWNPTHGDYREKVIDAVHRGADAYKEALAAATRRADEAEKSLTLAQQQVAAMRAENTRYRRIIWSTLRTLRRLEHKRVYAEDQCYEPGPLDSEWLWGKVTHVCAIGSTSAHALCREFGLDPESGEELPEAALTAPAEGGKE